MDLSTLLVKVTCLASIPSYVALSKSLYFSEPWCPYLYNRDHESAYFTGLHWDSGRRDSGALGLPSMGRSHPVSDRQCGLR